MLPPAASRGPLTARSNLPAPPTHAAKPGSKPAAKLNRPAEPAPYAGPARPLGASGAMPWEAEGSFDPRSFLVGAPARPAPTINSNPAKSLATSSQFGSAATFNNNNNNNNNSSMSNKPFITSSAPAQAGLGFGKPALSAILGNMPNKAVKLNAKKPSVTTGELQSMFKELALNPIHVKSTDAPARPFVILQDRPTAKPTKPTSTTIPPPAPQQRVRQQPPPLPPSRASRAAEAPPPPAPAAPTPSPAAQSQAFSEPSPLPKSRSSPAVTAAEPTASSAAASPPSPATNEMAVQAARTSKLPTPPKSPLQTPQRDMTPEQQQQINPTALRFTPRTAAPETAKFEELKARAQHLERVGDFAAALALLRTALALRPQSPGLAQHVDQLQDLLRAQFAPTQGSPEDPLAALIDPLESLTEPTTSMAQRPLSSPTPANSPSKKSPAATTVTARDSLRACLECVTKMRPSDKACEQAEKLLTALCQLDSMGSDTVGTRVRFRGIDGSACAPPPRQSSDMDAALGQTDEAIASLLAASKAADALNKSMTASGRTNLEQAMAGCGQSAQVFWHVLDLATKGHCTCGDSGCCELGAVAPRKRLGELLNSALRFCLRRALNRPEAGLQTNTGSYRHNDDDVAAVAHVALVLLDARLPLAEAVVLGLKLPKGETETDSAAGLAEFVEAYRFLSSLFPNAQAQTTIEDVDREAWGRVRRYVSIARDARGAGFKFEDEMLFGEWLKMADKLKGLAKIAQAAATIVDSAERKAGGTEERCKCAGAKRRRAAQAGSWLAPIVVRGGQRKASLRVCRECSEAVSEGGLPKIKCECCEEAFHLECLGLPADYSLDFCCTKCVGVPAKQPAPSSSASTQAEEVEKQRQG